MTRLITHLLDAASHVIPDIIASPLAGLAVQALAQWWLGGA